MQHSYHYRLLYIFLKTWLNITLCNY